MWQSVLKNIWRTFDTNLVLKVYTDLLLLFINTEKHLFPCLYKIKYSNLIQEVNGQINKQNLIQIESVPGRVSIYDATNRNFL